MDMVSGEIWKMYRVPLISVNNKSALSPALLHPPLREMAVWLPSRPAMYTDIYVRGRLLLSFMHETQHVIKSG